MFKKRKLDEFDCCICGSHGIDGFTNVFNITLRENNLAISFDEVILFTIGINVREDASQICAMCKTKVIEFYHFKKNSQAAQKFKSNLIYNIIKIVESFISKNEITSLKVEENSERLLITKSLTQSSNDLIITNVYGSVNDIEIKKEPDDEDDDETDKHEQVTVKKEPIEEESFEICVAGADVEIQNEQDELNENNTNIDNDEKLDMILSLNKQILALVKNLNAFCEPQDVNSSMKLTNL